jgi:photosystem II stability/assembly factor-like uncharacterized protein
MSAAHVRTLQAVSVTLLLSLACNLVSTNAPGPATEAPAGTVDVASPTSTALDATTLVPTQPASPTATASAFDLTPSPAPATPAPTQPPPGEPLPNLTAGQPVTLTVVKLLDPARGWAIGYGVGDAAYDHLLVTADGGQTWRDVSPPEARPAEPAGRAAVAYFSDPQTAWATYFARDIAPDGAALVWRTTDGGASWQPSAPLDLSDVEFFATSDLRFTDADHGWLLTHVGAGMNHDYVVVFATADGGQTWTRVVDPFDTRADNLQMSCLKTGLGFVSATTGWVTGDCQAVAPGVFLQRSDDGGATWAAVDLPAPTSQPDAFTRQDGGCGTYHLTTFAPQTVLMAVACQFYDQPPAAISFLYTSTDGGDTWASADLPARDVAWLDALTGWTIDPADPNDPAALRRLYQTTDGGAHWQYINTVTWSAQLNFVSAAEGWAVAQSGTDLGLVHTVNGGRAWALLAPLAAP